MFEALVTKLLRRYGRNIHYVMLVALGIVATLSLLINFTEYLDAYKNSVPLAIFIAGTWLCFYLYVQLGMLYQLFRFFRWIESYFSVGQSQK